MSDDNQPIPIALPVDQLRGPPVSLLTYRGQRLKIVWRRAPPVDK